MRQYAPGLKNQGIKITVLIEKGLKRYGEELKSNPFALIYSEEIMCIQQYEFLKHL